MFTGFIPSEEGSLGIHCGMTQEFSLLAGTNSAKLQSFIVSASERRALKFIERSDLIAVFFALPAGYRTMHVQAWFWWPDVPGVQRALLGESRGQMLW